MADKSSASRSKHILDRRRKTVGSFNRSYSPGVPRCGSGEAITWMPVVEEGVSLFDFDTFLSPEIRTIWIHVCDLNSEGSRRLALGSHS
ncbi:hypothetical protein JZ751_003626 [Albula glossodonta]|uniref:Uncharacterized protein n=1 Tax=Albula glossodonta TaxID=121402 RepID=A0A8T2N734_9TELE|nr:hypothetical protein JZ751_003626 [Albula glossodonta]